MKNRWRNWIVALAVAMGPLSVTPAWAIFADHFDSGAAIGAEKVPSTGSPNILVLRVNILTEEDPPWSKWDAAFNDGLWPNFFENYWDVVSLGAYTPETVLQPWIDVPDCPIPGADPCTFDVEDLVSVLAAIDFLKGFLRTAIQELGIYMPDYDLLGPDGVPDGWADGVLLLVNAPFRSIAFPLFVFDPTEYDGVRIGGVGVVNAFKDVDTALHEFGHLLGWADMYDEDKSSAGLTYTLMGNSRNYNEDERTSLINAYDRMRIGWANVIPVTGTQRVTLEPAATTGNVYRIGVSETEYFLVENRQPMIIGGFAFDAGGLVTDPGLAVWHVDDRVLGEITGLVGLPNLNREDWHPRVMLEQADGLYDLQNDIHTVEDADLFMEGDVFVSLPAHEPIGPDNPVFDSNYYSGDPSSFTLHNMDAVSDPPNILADFTYEDIPPPLFTCSAAVPATHDRQPSLMDLLPLVAALGFLRCYRTRKVLS